MENHRLTELIFPSYKSVNPLLIGEFRTQTNKRRVLHAHYDHIFIANKNKIIALTFETKFQLVRQPSDEKYKVGLPLGIRIERERSKHQVYFMSEDAQMLKAWRDYLAQRINQRSFHESFRAHKKIGKGNFASVYLADRLEDDKSFAIKAFSKEVAYGQEKGKDSIKNEIQIMRQLDSHALIKLHEVYETENSLYMVLDLLEGGSLYEKIKHKPTFNSNEIQVLIYTLLEGLRTMHQKRIMHRDLKPENILFRKPNVIHSVCIADFGLAQRADDFNYLFYRCGTPGFVAPEVVNCKDGGRYDPVCDVYSLGLIFYILLTGKPAFPGKSYNEVLARNRKAEIQFNGPLFDNVPQQAYDLLRKMLEKDPQKRITSDIAIMHPYFGKDQIVNDEEQGLSVQMKVYAEEQLRFDRARLKIQTNSPLHSPIITATHKMKQQIIDDEFVLNSPLMNGKVDALDSPGIASFNSPSSSAKQLQRIEQFKPSRFKDSQDNTPTGQQTPPQNLRNSNTLHKYAIKNEMSRQQQQGIQQVKDQLSKNI